jgi:hypothetical protein
MMRIMILMNTMNSFGLLGPVTTCRSRSYATAYKLECLMATVPILLLRSTAVYYDLGTGSRIIESAQCNPGYP